MKEHLRNIARSKPVRTGMAVLALATSLSAWYGHEKNPPQQHQPSIPAYSFGTYPIDLPPHLEIKQSSLELKPCIESGFTTDTLRSDGSDSTVFEVEVKQSCRIEGLVRIETELVTPYFTIDGVSPREKDQTQPLVILKDTGEGEDKKAGDWIFTSGKIRYDQRPLPDHLRPIPLFEGIPGLFQGVSLANYLKFIYADGSDRRAFGVPMLLVLDKNIPPTSLTKHSETVLTSSRIINLRDDQLVTPQFLNASHYDWEGLKKLTSNFYSISQKPDPIYFLVMGSNRDFWSLTSDGTFPSDTPTHYAGMAISTRRDFSGTGTGNPQGPEAAQPYGSQGKLRLITIVREPPSFPILTHEFTHWIGAKLGEKFGLDDGAHWRKNNSAEGILGGGMRWKDNDDGTFTINPRSFQQLSLLEQYLMGWVPPHQLHKIYVALNETQELMSVGAVIKGPFKTVTANDLIDAHGDRSPGPDTAPRHFEAGYILLTKGRAATQAEMTAREMFASHYPQFWNKATNRQSTMEFAKLFKQLTILEPAQGITTPDLSLELKYTVPPTTKWFHLQLVPFGNNGPGVNLLIGQPEIEKGELKIPAPVLGKGPYIQLPDMGYSWRIRTSSSLESPDTNQDKGWNPWVERGFRTPTVSSETIRLGSISDNQETKNLRPSLSWTNENQQVFYYEVQLSKDPTFNTDPKTARAAVYHNLVHGGFTNPPNSWTPPAQFSLEGNSRYYWRVRPRIQGDGTPVGWSAIGSFKTTS